MKHETKLTSGESIVTAICFGVGALLVVLALHTLSTVKTVHAVSFQDTVANNTLAANDSDLRGRAGTYSGVVTEETDIPGQAK